MFKKIVTRPQTAVPFAMAALAVPAAHSVRARGMQRSLLFAGLSGALAWVGEYMTINRTRHLQHHMQPQLAGVPVGALVGWYAIAYETFAVLEALAPALDPDARRQRWLTVVGTALAATSLDLILDPYGLALGLWEWTAGGAYATDIVGPNGQRGIPLANYVGWLGLTSAVPALYYALAGEASSQDGNAGTPEAGRAAALLLASTYLAVVVWAIQHGKPRFVLYSLLCPTVIVAAFRVPQRAPEAAA